MDNPPNPLTTLALDACIHASFNGSNYWALSRQFNLLVPEVCLAIERHMARTRDAVWQRTRQERCLADAESALEGAYRNAMDQVMKGLVTDPSEEERRVLLEEAQQYVSRTLLLFAWIQRQKAPPSPESTPR